MICFLPAECLNMVCGFCSSAFCWWSNSGWWEVIDKYNECSALRVEADERWTMFSIQDWLLCAEHRTSSWSNFPPTLCCSGQLCPKKTSVEVRGMIRLHKEPYHLQPLFPKGNSDCRSFFYWISAIHIHIHLWHFKICPLCPSIYETPFQQEKHPLWSQS